LSQATRIFAGSMTARIVAVSSTAGSLVNKAPTSSPATLE
jgi:hypothetical protein